MVGLLFLLGMESTCNDMGTIITQYMVVSREEKKKQGKRDMGTKRQVKTQLVPKKLNCDSELRGDSGFFSL